jgi:hypothetical protein
MRRYQLARGRELAASEGRLYASHGADVGPNHASSA